MLSDSSDCLCNSALEFLKYSKKKNQSNHLFYCNNIYILLSVYILIDSQCIYNVIFYLHYYQQETRLLTFAYLYNVQFNTYIPMNTEN